MFVNGLPRGAFALALLLWLPSCSSPPAVGLQQSPAGKVGQPAVRRAIGYSDYSTTLVNYNGGGKASYCFVPSVTSAGIGFQLTGPATYYGAFKNFGKRGQFFTAAGVSAYSQDINLEGKNTATGAKGYFNITQNGSLINWGTFTMTNGGC